MSKELVAGSMRGMTRTLRYFKRSDGVEQCPEADSVRGEIDAAIHHLETAAVLLDYVDPEAVAE